MAVALEQALTMEALAAQLPSLVESPGVEGITASDLRLLRVAAKTHFHHLRT